MKRFLVGIACGGVLMLAAVASIDLAQYVANSPEPSAQAVSKPLEPLEVDPSWISQGDPKFKAIETTVSPDGNTMVGLWECTGPTTFTWHFGWDETVHLIAGEVEVDYLGKKFTLRPGDTAVFHANTQATWTIDDYALKSYTLYRPSLAGQAYRQLFAPEA